MVTFLNAYKVPRPSKKSCAEAAIFRGYDWLVDDKGNFRDRINRSNLAALGFLELTVESSLDIRKFECSNGQVPYLEVYLDEVKDVVLYNPNFANEKRIGSLETLPDRFRVLFFLHFVMLRPKFSYDGKKLSIPAFEPLPEHLSPHAQYIPVG